MKGVKGRILKRFKSIPNVGYLKQGRVLHDLPVYKQDQESDAIDVSGLMSDTREEEDEKLTSSIGNKENIRPASTTKESTPSKNNPEPEIESKLSTELGVHSFRRPDLNSSTLFDPNLLAAFQRAVMDHIQSHEEARSRARATEEEQDPYIDGRPPLKVLRTNEEEEEGEEEEDPLMEFEYRCPPGGSEAVIFYTTSLRGIRKTFEDCKSVRFLLKSLKVLFYERDVSMHLEFREELWRVLGGRVIPPRLFIRGRYIGGDDEVLGLHEQGELLPLLKGLPRDRSGGASCERCGGIRFIVCSECDGSRRVYGDEIVQCLMCNENGLVICPLCCC